MSESDLTPEQYIRNLEQTFRISEPALRQAIEALGIERGRGLDIPCGIGNHAVLMVERYPEISIECSDFSQDHLEYARRLAVEKGLDGRLTFAAGDMNRIEYPDDSFDFVWCCDALWPGPVEAGCIAEEPYAILDELNRIVRPGGTVAVLFWSSQKILPGYPLVESALNATPPANFPVNEETPPSLHIMNAAGWLRRAGLTNVVARTFTADICGPLGEDERESMEVIASMFWGASEGEVDAEIWDKYRAIVDPDSESYIFSSPDYAGFITYTLFSGTVGA